MIVAIGVYDSLTFYANRFEEVHNNSDDMLRSVANEVASSGIIAMDTYTPLVWSIVLGVLFDSEKGISVLDA